MSSAARTRLAWWNPARRSGRPLTPSYGLVAGPNTGRESYRATSWPSCYNRWHNNRNHEPIATAFTLIIGTATGYMLGRERGYKDFLKLFEHDKER